MATLYLVKVLGLSLAFWSARNSLKSWSIVFSGLRFFIGSSVLRDHLSGRPSYPKRQRRPRSLALALPPLPPYASAQLVSRHAVPRFRICQMAACTSNHGG